MKIKIEIVLTNSAPEDAFVRALEEIIEDTNAYGLGDGPILDEERNAMGSMTLEDV